VPAKKVSASRVIVFGVLVVTGLYVVCVVGLTIGQRKLLYYPCKQSIAEAQPMAAKIGFRPWENSTGEPIGWFRASQTGPAARTILLLHGNAGCASGWFHYAEGFQAAEPIDFYILEYPGYGGRSGAPTQSTILHAADDAVASLSRKCRFYIVGESLGTGPACYLAGKYGAKVKGVFLVAPYNNLAAAASAHLPLFPVKWMLKDKYPSEQWLKDYHGPLAVMLGGKDEVIPNELGRKLFDGYGGPKKSWFKPEATHGDLHDGAPVIAKEVMAFWKNHEAENAAGK
jgi:pimeloyl-ACP methyl ester carboxylesterase